MRLILSGASGLLGPALMKSLGMAGYDIRQLVRSAPEGEGQIQWNPYAGVMDATALDGADALIHLSGENIMGLRWTDAKKRAIRASRIKTTEFLCKRLCEMPHPPKTWLCASAIGFYGNRGKDICDEDSPPGSGFFSALCQDWEDATKPAREKGIRVVNLRLGLVFSPDGGMLPMLIKTFRLGLGGVVGRGDQYMSWVAIQDVLSAVQTLLEDDSFQGPVNIVAPNPVTNREFTKTLGRVVSRPTFMHVPAFALRLAAGELADEALLASTRVYPRRLLDAGFAFSMQDLEGALSAMVEM